ncbi:MAG: Gfo/Idh/MocA family protein [Kiritimatiellia bacterium]
MQMNRRHFLGASAAFAAPFVFSGCVGGVRKFAANEKVNVGVIGIGRISTTMDMPLAARHKDLCRITAVCDLDSNRLAHGVDFVKKLYKEDPGYQVKPYADYHDLLADPSIDAVEICIPDHWHTLVACAALAAGKHIWLQKPFSQTITEGRIIANLAKMRNRVVQVGSWQRSKPQFHLVCELVANGRIGEIRRVEVGIGCDRSGGSSKVEPVPANLNYDMWLGPTPGADVTPYNWTRVHQQDLGKIGDRPGWIQMAPYGWGMITNWGAHHIDIAQWGLGKDDSGPDGVSGTCSWMDTTGGRLWNVHTHYDLHYSYNGGRTDVHVCDKFPMGVKFIGEKGEWLYCMRGTVKVTPSDPDVPSNGKMQPLMASKNRLLEPIASPAVRLRTSADHWRNWLEAIRAGDPDLTVTNAEAAQRSSTACCLGQMCMELGRGKKGGATVAWRAEKEDACSPEARKLMVPFSRGKYDVRLELARYGLDYDKVLRG